MLDEYGELTLTAIAGSTSDSGSDIKRLCDTLLPGDWDWCISHLINAALADAFGTHLDKQKSKNKPTREVIMSMRKVIEHMVSRAADGACDTT